MEISKINYNELMIEPTMLHMSWVKEKGMHSMKNSKPLFSGIIVGRILYIYNHHFFPIINYFMSTRSLTSPFIFSNFLISMFGREHIPKYNFKDGNDLISCRHILIDSTDIEIC